MCKRVEFKKGYQRKLLEKIHSHISVKEMARFSRCSERTIRDWRREKFFADINAIKSLCKKTGIIFPNKDITAVRDRYWYTTLGAYVGAKAVLRKYGQIGGDPIYRRRRWREWWECKGKHNPNSITKSKPIHIPKKSKELAEFVGIVLGDGSITKNQITVTLHRIDDKEYGEFLTKLIISLFKVPVNIYKSKQFLADDYVISRVRLVAYCVDELGLKIGNKVKQQVDIPQWIKENKEFSIACTRGLVDTDGSVFPHSYVVKSKKYTYKKLAFSNSSRPIIDFVYWTLSTLKINARITRDNKNVRIDAVDSMMRYFQLIGTHNQKHLNHYKK